VTERETYLVTGGCGFIGSHLVEALAGEGHVVRVLDDLSSGFTRNLEHIQGRVEIVVGDVRDPAQTLSAMEGVSYVFHEAALVSVFDSVNRPRDNHDINLTGTLNVLEAARAAGVRRVVMASSAAIYGNNPELPKREDMRPEPESPYAIGKIGGEYMLRVYHRLYGLETASLRYFNVFGPRQDPGSMYSGVISKFSSVLAAGGTPKIFGDGGQTRDFVYVKDVVQANLLAMRAPAAAGGVFNIGTGSQTSLLDLLSALQSIAGRSGAPEFAEARAGDIRDSVADISRAREILGYAPRATLREGLAELWASLEARG
jgi:UDP-glucose 4-epimerase